MESFYQTWLTLYPSESFLQRDKFRWILIQVSRHIIILAQNIQFLWFSGLKIKNWEDFELFWSSLSIVSFDFIAVKFRMVREFLFFEIIVTTIGLLALFFIFFLNYYKKNNSQAVLSSVKVLISFICELSFIPTCIFFLLVFKYSSSTLPSAKEYPSGFSSADFNYGIFGKILPVLILSIVLILTFFYEICSYSPKYFPSEKNINGKITVKSCLLSKSVYFINCYMHVNFKQTNYQIFLITEMVLYSICCIYTLYTIPFYSYKINFMKIFVHLDCALLSLIFLIGFYLDNSGIIILLSPSIQFLAFPLTYSLISFRISLILPSQDSIYHSFQNYELSIRSDLIKRDIPCLLKQMQKNYKYSKDPMSCIIQAYYIDEILENPILALNIITKIPQFQLNMLTRFQAYRCRCFLTKKCEESSDSIKIMEFFDDFSSTKIKDMKFCEAFGKLICQLQDKKSKLSHLKNLTTIIVTSCANLIKKYKFLIKSHPQAQELKKLYGTLLMNILGDSVSGEHYLFDIQDVTYHDIQTISPFSFHQRRCFFIVSCAEDSFGKIIHYNDNFLKLLSITPEIAKELYIDNLMVPNLCKNPSKAIKKFIEKGITHNLLSNSGLPLLSSEGFLCEGIVNSELISFKKNLYFVCSFDPLISKKREVALLNKYGAILGHTKNFAKYFVPDNRIILQETFSNLVSEKIENDIIENTIFPLNSKTKNINKKNLFGVFKKINFIGNRELKILYVTDSEEEVLSWKKNFEDFYRENEIDAIFKVTSEAIPSRLNLMSSEQENNDTHQLLMGTSNMSKSVREKSIESIKSDGEGITEVEVKSLKKAVFVLNMTKLVLFLSIVVMIISSIAALSYISLEVKHSNSLKPMINLGDIGYLVSGVSFILRYLDASIHGNYTAYYTYENVENLLALLKEKKNVLSDEYSEWAYCPSSKIIKEKNIPYWVYEKKPILRYSNLPDLLDIFLSSSYSIVKEMQEGKNNYSDHLFFVAFISMGNSFDVIYNAMMDLEKCELSRIDNLKAMSQYLLFASFAVLSCCFFFILCFLLNIDKDLNVLWEHLGSKVKSRFNELQNCISERLVEVHNRNDFSINKIENASAKNHKTINFRHSLHYLWRFSIMIIFVVIFYILCTFVFEANVHNNLYHRPELISIILQRRIKSNQMCFFTLETELRPTHLSLLSLFPEFNSINPPGEALSSVIKFLSFSQSQIIKKTLQNLMSSTLRDIILKGDPSNPPFLKLGSIRGLAYLLQESFFISFNGQQDDPIVFSKFVSNVIEYTNIGKIATKMANEDSQSIIEDLLSELLNFNIICCIFMLLGYLFYYYPFLNFEIKMLNKITKVLKILNK